MSHSYQECDMFYNVILVLKHPCHPRHRYLRTSVKRIFLTKTGGREELSGLSKKVKNTSDASDCTQATYKQGVLRFLPIKIIRPIRGDRLEIQPNHLRPRLFPHRSPPLPIRPLPRDGRRLGYRTVSPGTRRKHRRQAPQHPQRTDKVRCKKRPAAPRQLPAHPRKDYF